MSKQKYTFEDWKAGKIRDDYVNNEIKDFNDQKLYGIGYLPQQLNEQGFITDEEYSKIENAQKETFDLGVKHSVETFFNDFKKELENAFKPAELIKNKIERLKYELEDASNYTLHQVYAGEWSKTGAGYISFLIAKNPEEKGLVYLHNMIKTPAHNTRTVNHVFVHTIKVRLIDKLESLLEAEYLNSNNKKEELTREQIFNKASRYKRDGMKVREMFKKIRTWLIDDMGFTENEIKKRYDFSLKNPDNFNRVVNKNTPFHN